MSEHHIKMNRAVAQRFITLLAALLSLSTVAVAQDVSVVTDTVNWHRYFPLAVGNTWEYIDGEAFPETRLELLSDTTVGGKTYFRARESLYGIIYPSTETALFDLNDYFIRYDTSGVVLFFDSIENDVPPYPESFSLGLLEIRHIDLRSAFGDTFSFGTESWETISVSGGSDRAVRVAGVSLPVDALKIFTYGIGYFSYATDIGFIGGGNLWGPRLMYAKINGAEFGERVIHVGIDSDDILPLSLDITTLYPNPASEILHYAIQNPNRRGLVIEIWDVLGRMRIKDMVARGRNEVFSRLDLSRLPNGQYHLVVTSDIAELDRQSFILVR